MDGTFYFQRRAPLLLDLVVGVCFHVRVRVCMRVYVRPRLAAVSCVATSVDGRAVPLICKQPTFRQKIKGTSRLGGTKNKKVVNIFWFHVGGAVVYNILIASPIKIFCDYNFLKVRYIFELRYNTTT